MNETEITTENFERDSLEAFEKLLQGYKKATRLSLSKFSVVISVSFISLFFFNC